MSVITNDVLETLILEMTEEVADNRVLLELLWGSQPSQLRAASVEPYGVPTSITNISDYIL